MIERSYFFARCLLFFVLISKFVLAQDLEPQPDPSTFEDPFSETEDQAPEDPVSPPELLPASPVGPAVSPSFEPSVENEEGQPFELPVVEKESTPVTQDIVESESFAASRSGRWNLMTGLGAGLNVNRRYQQFHLELSGGYRWDDHWEFAGLVSYRTVKDQLVGMIGLVRWAYAFIIANGLRAEILPHAGMGWTIRMKPSGSKFSEGRFTLRAGADLLMYAKPDFAITAGISMESFLFLVDSDSGSQSLLKNGGPPSQLIFTVGPRWAF